MKYSITLSTGLILSSYFADIKSNPLLNVDPTSSILRRGSALYEISDSFMVRNLWKRGSGDACRFCRRFKGTNEGSNQDFKIANTPSIAKEPIKLSSEGKELQAKPHEIKESN